MDVQLTDNNELILVPETEFESQFIDRNFGRGELKAFVKCGLTPAELIGIKILPNGKKETDGNEAPAGEKEKAPFL